MKQELTKIGLGGGCHWCTEAVFQSLIGIERVEQGYVASTEENDTFSEAVIVYFYAEIIPLKTLIEVHLHTHKSTSNHSMRAKYRSAVYCYSEAQQKEVDAVLVELQSDFEHTIITVAMPFKEFKPSRNEITNYYYKNPDKPFCKTFIDPKLKLLLQKFSEVVDTKKVISVEVANPKIEQHEKYEA